jgi:hypothetical protein
MAIRSLREDGLTHQRLTVSRERDLAIVAECDGPDACRRLVEAFLLAIVSTIDPRRPR